MDCNNCGFCLRRGECYWDSFEDYDDVVWVVNNPSKCLDYDTSFGEDVFNGHDISGNR